MLLPTAKTKLSLESCMVMAKTQNNDGQACEAFSCNRQRRMQEIMGDIKLNNRSLDLGEVRREQRRVAALMGHGETQYKPNTIYKSPRGGKAFHYCVCSKLHSHLQCSHASHNFLQEGLANVREARSKVNKTKHSTALKRRYSVDSAELQRRHLRGVKGRSLTPMNKSPSLIKGTLHFKDSVRTKDIREFDYSHLAEDLVGKELGHNDNGGLLPSIYRTTSLVGHFVPENTPEASEIKMRTKKSLRNQNSENNGGGDTTNATVKGSKHNEKPQVILTKMVKGSKDSGDKGKIMDTLRYTHSHVPDSSSAMDYCRCGATISHNKAESVEADNSVTSGYHTDSPKSGDTTTNTENIIHPPPPKSSTPREDARKPSRGHHFASGSNSGGRGKHILTRGHHRHQQLGGHPETIDGGGRWCSSCGKCVLPKVEEASGKHGGFSRTQAAGAGGYRSSGLPGGGYAPLSREHSLAVSVNSISSGSFIRLHEEYGDKYEDRERSGNFEATEPGGRLMLLSDYEAANPDDEDDAAGIVVEDSDAEEASKRHRSKGRYQGYPRLTGNTDLYPNGYNEAYDKALAASRYPQLPLLEPWMLGSRISKPYQFSYFMPNPYPVEEECEGCNKPLKKFPAKAEHLPKKVKPMRHVFGRLDVNDFYPGGKRNPLHLRK